MQTGMLGDNEVLRRLWDGPLKDLVLKLNSTRGPEYEEQLKKLLRDEMVPISVALPSAGINPDITQANTPSGHGRRRPVVLEFFEFNHDPTTEDVRARCEESGYGYPTYEDGLRFQEDRPDDQRGRPHVFIPENPWCGTDGDPQALDLWCHTVVRKLDLDCCFLGSRWSQRCLFARRKYS